MQNKVNSIIIWNQIKNLEEAKKIFLNSIIIPAFNKYNIPSNEIELAIVTSPTIYFDPEFNTSEKIQIAEYDYIFILAELKWFGNHYSSFYGFEVLKKLREDKIRTPVFVLSGLDINDLNFRHPNFCEILNTTGHYYIKLNKEGIEVIHDREIKPLSIEGLEDISEYLFTKSGYISENLHRLKNLLLKTKNLSGNTSLLTEIANPYFKNIQQILEPEYQQDFMKLKQSLINNLNLGHSPLESIEILKNHILKLINISDISPYPPELEYKPWRILYIDDEKHICKLVRDKISGYGISCITAETSHDALRILSGDMKIAVDHSSGKYPANSITVLIADVRLIKPSGVWDDYQGYDLCEKIYTGCSNILSFFLLTHKIGFVKKIASNNKGVNKIAFSKEVLNNINSFHIFMNKVIEEGDKVWNDILHRPKSTYWYTPYIAKSEVKFAHGLGHYYRHYLLSRNYNQTEKKISITAASYVREVIEMRAAHGIVELQRKFEFRSNLKSLESEDPNKIMEKFYHKLIGRRIAIALWLFNLDNLRKTDVTGKDDILDNGQSWSIDEIAFLLGKGYLPFDIYDDLGNRANSILENLIKSLINTHLALSKHLEKDIPENILIEEKIWLRDYFDFIL